MPGESMGANLSSYWTPSMHVFHLTISYNLENILVSKEYAWIVSVIIANCQHWQVGCENSPTNFLIGLWSGSSFVGQPKPKGSTLTPGGIRIELNCTAPIWCPEKWRIGWYEEKPTYICGVRNVSKNNSGLF